MGKVNQESVRCPAQGICEKVPFNGTGMELVRDRCGSVSVWRRLGHPEAGSPSTSTTESSSASSPSASRSAPGFRLQRPQWQWWETEHERSVSGDQPRRRGDFRCLCRAVWLQAAGLLSFARTHFHWDDRMPRDSIHSCECECVVCTTGLRRVTDDMKTKNRADRSGAVPAGPSSQKKDAGQPAASARAGTPKFELQQDRK